MYQLAEEPGRKNMVSRHPRSDVLGRLLVIQQFLEMLPDRERMAGFLRLTLLDIPGISGCRVVLDEKESGAEPEGEVIEIRTPRKVFGRILIFVKDDITYRAYEPFLDNIAQMVGTVIENRENAYRLSEANERLNGLVGELEQRVEERTRALAISEERLRLALEVANDGIWDWDLKSGSAYLSQRYREMTGYGEAGSFPDFFRKLVHPDDLSRVTGAIKAHLRGETPFIRIEHRMLTRSGETKWVLGKGSVVNRDARGNPLRMVGTISDITEMKLAEAALQTADETYRSLFENMLNAFAHCRMIFLDGVPVDFEILRINPAFEKVTGLKEVEGRRMSEIIPGYCEENPEALEIFGQVAQTGKSARWEHYLSSQEKWLSFMIYSPALGEFVLIGENITERKKAEESLLLAGMVYSNTGEAIVVTDADNRIIATNPAFTEITGYTEGEVIGRNPNVLSSGVQEKKFYRDMWRELSETGKWEGEIRNRKKNGGLYDEHLSINTIYHDDGSIFRRFGLFMDITEKKKSEELIWKQANFDQLTALPNRRMLKERVEQEIRKANRANEPFALLFVDLDRFKDINDTLGHQIGDKLLIEAAKRLTNCIRETDIVARLGGDEFVVVLTLLHGAGSINRLVQDMLSKLAEPYLLGSELIYISASIGITVYPDDATNYDQLLKFADQAMYVAKQQGRNGFSYFTPSLQNAARERLDLISELSGALESGQMRTYFQPIVELETGRIQKAEALLRWQHPRRGMVSPMSFIPLAEETGLITSIGDWVFRESMRWAARWEEVSKEGFQISVNKSPVQFRARQSNAEDWPEYIRKMGLSGRNLVIEITESMLLDNDKETQEELMKLRDAGIQVSIDDFGTGYSALSYLKKFDIDYLKIDQSFVRNVAQDPSDLALCEAIVVMAHKLGLKVIAEGVETRQQRELLTKIGCDFGQGYLFARPMPGEMLDALLRKTNCVFE